MAFVKETGIPFADRGSGNAKKVRDFADTLGILESFVVSLNDGQYANLDSMRSNSHVAVKRLENKKFKIEVIGASSIRIWRVE